MTAVSFESPLGWVTITEQDGCISRLNWGGAHETGVATPLLDEAREQLTAYFERRLQRFDLPLSCPSTPFQHGVLEAMFSIPYGETKTYGDIADYVQGSPQAVGRACGANPIPILIPCHRVVGASGLGGFSGHGGVESKVFLLRLEGAAGLLI
jgi:methylated-DNA-[protein]-cysteine S-methyltransferase